MKKRFDVVTAMDVCIDLLVDMGDMVPQFGQKEQIIDGFETVLGGSACIFASQCAKLGLRTGGAGSAGTDALGKLFCEELERTGVCMEYIRREKGIQTGVGIALNRRNKDRAILTFMGTIGRIDEADFLALAKETRHVHIASYYLLKDMQKVYQKILPELKKEGVTVSLDTNWDPEEKWDANLNDILPYVDILLVNEQELLFLSGRENETQAVQVMQECVPVVVVKKGGEGAKAYAGGAQYKALAGPEEVVDTVGAGDSFDAGFVYGFLSGMSVKDCLELGCFCGSRSVTQAGGTAGQPEEKEIIKWKQEIQREETKGYEEHKKKKY